MWMGRGYMSLGRPQDAIVVLERALALRPRDYRIISSYSDCSDMLGRKEVVARMLVRMRDVLGEVLERNPHDTYARGMFSIVLAQSGEPAAGVAQAEQALAAEHEDGRVLYNTACTFVYAGQPDRAVGLLRAMIDSHPGFPRNWLRHDPDFRPLHQRPDFLALIGPEDPPTSPS